MNRFGMWAFGVVCGVVAMQIGLGLYLRSADFAFAAIATVLLGAVVVAGCDAIGNAWC